MSAAQYTHACIQGLTKAELPIVIQCLGDNESPGPDTALGVCDGWGPAGPSLKQDGREHNDIACWVGQGFDLHFWWETQPA